MKRTMLIALIFPAMLSFAPDAHARPAHDGQSIETIDLLWWLRPQRYHRYPTPVVSSSMQGVAGYLAGAFIGWLF